MIFAAVSDYKQSLQFQNLNEEKQNIQMEVSIMQCNNSSHLYSSHFFLYSGNYLQVVRNGRRIKVSIFEIVVGDIVPLKIGDQVM